MSEEFLKLSQLYEFLEDLGLPTKSIDINGRSEAYFFGKDLDKVISEHKAAIEEKASSLIGKSIKLTENNAVKDIVNLSIFKKIQVC